MPQPEKSPIAAPSICILYGLAEGERTGRQLRHALVARGWTITHHADGADAILAHSGGCFLVPKNTPARLIILIGIPYWPGKGLFASTIHKTRLTRRQNSAGDWLRDELRHLWYLPALRQDYRMWLGRRRGALWTLPPNKTVVVRNQQDSYMTPDPKALPFNEKPAYEVLPGNHDDLWRNPEPYIELIKRYL